MARLSREQLALYHKTLKDGSRAGGPAVWNDGNIRELLEHIEQVEADNEVLKKELHRVAGPGELYYTTAPEFVGKLTRR